MKFFNAPLNTSSPSPEPAKWHWGWATALAFITLATLAFRYALPIRDGDIFFHLLYAKYFIENLTIIPDHTIFSWTQTDGNDIYCAWLSELFFYAIFKLGHLYSLFTFRYFIAFLFVFACWRFAKKLDVANHPLTWLICLVGVLMSYVGIFAKPEGFTYAFMTLFCWNWWHIRTSKTATLINFYLFPIGMLIWVNSHGGFIIGLIYLGVLFIGELLNITFRLNVLTSQQRKHFFTAIFLSGMTVILTPYGYDYPLQVILLHLPTPENEEYMKPIAAMSKSFSMEGDFLSFAELGDIAAILIGILLLLNLKTQKTDFSLLLSNIIFAIAYTKYVRTTFYWAPIFSFSSIYLLSLRPSLLFSRKTIPKIITFAVTIILTLTLSAKSIYDSYYHPELFLWPGFGYSEMIPMEEAKYVQKYFPMAKIGNTYNSGTTLLWHIWPQNKVFIDARHFPYKSWSQELFKFENAKNIDAFMEKYPADLWLIDLQKNKLCFWFADSPDWKVAFYGKTAAVFVKTDIRLPQDVCRVGKGVASIRSPETFFSFFLFALKIQDWRTIEQLLEVVPHLAVNKAEKKRITNFAQTYVDGMEAFHQHDYETAVQKLESAHQYKLIVNDKALAYSHMALMFDKMVQGDIKASYDLSKAALKKERTIYTVYNAGILGWAMSQQESKMLSHTAKPDQIEWRQQLEEYLNMIPPADEPFATASKQVKSILQGEVLDTMPKILINSPPLPFMQFEH